MALRSLYSLHKRSFFPQYTFAERSIGIPNIWTFIPQLFIKFNRNLDSNGLTTKRKSCDSILLLPRPYKRCPVDPDMYEINKGYNCLDDQHPQCVLTPSSRWFQHLPWSGILGINDWVLRKNAVKWFGLAFKNSAHTKLTKLKISITKKQWQSSKENFTYQWNVYLACPLKSFELQNETKLSILIRLESVSNLAVWTQSFEQCRIVFTTMMWGNLMFISRLVVKNIFLGPFLPGLRKDFARGRSHDLTSWVTFSAAELYRLI